MDYKKLILIGIIILSVFLRFYKINEVPPGLYIDEVSIGYNAYTILQNGIDEHNKKYPLWFEAFGEYKMPVYIYFTSASIALFGKNDFAVRFPSALFGVLSVIALYFLVKELSKDIKLKLEFKKKDIGISELSALILAISPWHIQFSRAGFEANVALFFFLLAIYLSVIYLKKKNFLILFFTILSYVLSMYTYQVYRILAPMTAGIFLFFLYPSIKQIKKQILVGIAIAFLMIFPLLQFSLSKEGNIRFSQTSVFAGYEDKKTIEKIQLFPMMFFKNYVSYFSFPFLFNYGDGIGRHQMPRWGGLFRFELPFLIAGLYFLFTQRKTFSSKLIFLLIIIIPISAALARPSPHSLRSLPLVIPLSILISIGIIFLIKNSGRFLKLLLILIFVFSIYEFLFYFHYYYDHYPKVNILDWGGGYKQVAERATVYHNKNYKVVVDKNLGNSSYIYLLFYNSNLTPLYVDVTWEKPKSWGKQKVLYIRQYYGVQKAENILENIYLPNQNSDIFAQFWEL